MLRPSPPGDAGDADPAWAGLRRELEGAKNGDPLAPVTVVAPSAYAAVFVRRALAAPVSSGGRQGWANLTVTTVPALLRRLGDPVLAGRGLRLVPPVAELEAIRRQAGGTEGWLGQFSSHPSALTEIRRALAQLRRCPAETLDAVRRHRGPGAVLVGLLDAVRRQLHDCGLADGADLAAGALEGAGGDGAGPAPEPIVAWQLGPLSPTETEILRRLRARPAGREAPSAASLSEIRPCADPDEEGRRALRSIIENAEAGTALWQQAVFHPPGPSYPRLLHQHLARAGVASHGPQARRLDRSVTGRALLGLLDLAGSDWPRDLVVDWLSSGPVTFGPRGGPVPARRWDLVSARAGVVRGPVQWHERLGRLAGGGGAGGGGAEADEAAALAAFMDDLTTEATPPGGSWAAFSSWALGLLDQFLLPDADPERWPEAERHDAARVRAVVATLAHLDQVSAGADLGAFRHLLRTQLEGSGPEDHDGVDGGAGDGVLVAPYTDARGLYFPAVVVTGLADALVPGPDTDDALLGDEVRHLDTSGALPTRAARRRAAREDLAGAVAAGSGRRVGTYPCGDPRTGRAHGPSRWLADLVGPGTRRYPVASFAAGLVDADPVVSAREWVLRELDAYVGRGGDPGPAVAAAGDERLARGFAAARDRADTRFTRFDGLVGPRRVAAFDPGRPVSATRFETYAACPRRYLFERVLDVSERVRPEELWRIEPLTRGTLVHAILEEYVAGRVAGAPRSLDRLLALADARLDQAEDSGLVGRPLIWRVDRAAIVRDLTRFHAEEGDLTPVAAELSFGGDDDPGSAVTVVLADGRAVAFRGSVDRVDRTPAGHLLVSDYKTGRQTRLGDLARDPVAGGKLLQLPLYARAARARFGGDGPVHARYWLLSEDRAAPCYHLVVTDEVDSRFRTVVGAIADGVEQGCFPGVPGPAARGRFTHCLSCDFDSICPVTRDRHWGRTFHAPELRGVVALVSGEVPAGLTGSVVKGFVDPDAETAP